MGRLVDLRLPYSIFSTTDHEADGVRVSEVHIDSGLAALVDLPADALSGANRALHEAKVLW